MRRQLHALAAYRAYTLHFFDYLLGFCFATFAILPLPRFRYDIDKATMPIISGYAIKWSISFGAIYICRSVVAKFHFNIRLGYKF